MTEDLSAAHVREVVAETARRLELTEPGLARQMADVLAREIADLDTDPELRELLFVSVDGNIKTILSMLTNDISLEHLSPPLGAVEYALRLAQRGVPAASLIRAYHMGQDNFRVSAYAEVQRGEHTPELRLLVLDRISTIIYGYIDRVIQMVLTVYEDERSRWASAQGNVATTLIHAVLADSAVDEATFATDTGYPLTQVHLGLIAWTAGPTPRAAEHRPLELFVRKLADELHCPGPPLVSAVDRTTAWAWLPRPRRASAVDPATVRAVVAGDPQFRVALGLPASGAAGFRRTHEQAQFARELALLSPDRTPAVLGFGDQGVAITALLARSPVAARAWVAAVLGPLAIDDEVHAALRDTLRVFFLTGESYGQTAQRLNLHRNTVKYRVGKVLEERRSALGRELADDRLDFAMALQAAHFLGTGVLSGSPVS